MDCQNCDEEWVNELIEVLGFYANPETYHAILFLPDPPCGAFMDDFGDNKEKP